MFSGALGLALSWTRIEILRFLALSSALQVTVDFGAELLSGIVPWGPDYKFSGMLGYNREAYVCIVLTFSALCLARQGRSDRWFYSVLASCGFVFLLLTRSRGGQLAFFTALVLYLLVTLGVRQRVFAVFGIATLALVLIMSGVAPTLLSVLDRGGEGSENFNGRGPLWEELMVYARRRPLTGYGYENFWTASMISDVSGDQGWQMSDAHSGYLESLLQLGWPGAALHALTLITCMGVGIRLFRRTGAYVYFLSAALCLIYLVGGLLEGLMIIKASEISFDFALLLCVTAVQPQYAAREDPASQRPVDAESFHGMRDRKGNGLPINRQPHQAGTQRCEADRNQSPSSCKLMFPGKYPNRQQLHQR